VHKHPHLHGYCFAYEQQPQGRKKSLVKSATETSYRPRGIVFTAKYRGDDSHRLRRAPKKLRSGGYGSEYVRGNRKTVQMQSIPQNFTGAICHPALIGGVAFFF
jgi:hypothetical protein